LKALRHNAKSYRNETAGPRSDLIAFERLRVRVHKTRRFAKKVAAHPERKRVSPTPVSGARSPVSMDHIEGALRAVDTLIAEGEHRLFAHRRLMEKFKDRSALTLAQNMQLNLETGLHLMRLTRERLLKELEQDRSADNLRGS
jgi:hypothetical protein